MIFLRNVVTNNEWCPSSHPPRYEGNMQRFIFRKDSASSDYIPGISKDGKIIIYAGTYVGAAKGARFDIFAYSDKHPHVYLTQLEVSHLGHEEVYMSAPRNMALPNHFYAKLAGFAPEHRLRVYTSNDRFRKFLKDQSSRTNLFLTIASEEELSDVVVDMKDDMATFHWSSSRKTELTGNHPGGVALSIGTPVSLKDKERIIDVFSSAAKFILYSSSTSPNAEQVAGITLGRLEQKDKNSSDWDSHPIMEMDESDLLFSDGDDSDVIKLELGRGDEKKYVGMTIKNKQKLGLYPYVFWFDADDLSIGKICIPL